MITDTLAHAGAYSRLGSSIAGALEYLRTVDPASLADGRFDVDASGEYAMVQRYTTGPVDSKRWEAHRRYVDVQYVIEGMEWIGYAPLEELRSVEPYDDSRDIQWFEGDGSFIKLPRGSFAILFPQDAHKPGVHLAAHANPVRKIVFKLNASP